MYEDIKHVLWTEKYRPNTLEDCILPEHTKETFRRFVEQGELPNLLLVGTPGTGKTTLAKSLINDIDAEYIMINGAKDGNIDTLRTTIQSFVSTVSMNGGRKYVIIDEADGLNANSTQTGLKSFMEEFSGNAGFILTANKLSAIIEPLRSRLVVVDFKIPHAEASKIAQHMMKRAIHILQTENVEYETSAIVALIKTNFPDFRRMINTLWYYSKRGKIDAGMFDNQRYAELNELFDYLAHKNFTSMRKWVATNADINVGELFSQLYDKLPAKLTQPSIPALVLLLAEYQYKSAFAVDQQINTAALLTEIMTACEFNG